MLPQCRTKNRNHELLMDDPCGPDTTEYVVKHAERREHSADPNERGVHRQIALIREIVGGLTLNDRSEMLTG